MRLNKGKASLSIEAVRAAIVEIERELDRLEGGARELQDRWDGDAREAFTTAMREWDASARELRAIASEAARIAAESVARFDEFDRRRASAWSR